MLTHAGETYLGDPALEPLFGELDRRHARLFIHPTSPLCWEQTSFGRTRAMVEFLFDTSRAVVNMVLNGVVARHPNIEVIVPHAGAALPVIADRVAAFAFILEDLDPGADVYRDLARLHYDLAGFPAAAPTGRAPRPDDRRAPSLRERLPLHAGSRRRHAGGAPRRDRRTLRPGSGARSPPTADGSSLA